MFIMIRRGWRIHNASPFFSFVFPAWATVGNWLGGALAWHFAAMWVLTINLLLDLAYGLISGHLRRRMLPLWPYGIAQDFIRALRFRPPHEDGTCNAVQRLS
jgi:thiosulfate reductase cytochrome b subunit